MTSKYIFQNAGAAEIDKISQYLMLQNMFLFKINKLDQFIPPFIKIYNKKHIGWVHEFMKQDFQIFTFFFECWATLDGLDKWISGCSLRGMSSHKELCTIKVVVAQ